MKKKAVIALGGNALIRKDQKGTIYEQFSNTRKSVKSIVKMIKDDWEVVITHGNGPQVGSILLQNKAAKHLTPEMPLGICVAESEGLIGYMIQQCLSNALKKEKLNKSVITLITQIIVDQDDPSLQNPSKPIGPYYDEAEATQLQEEGVKLIHQIHGWRMVVPSPDPQYIVEGNIIKKLLEEGIIVIASGGGGMPVVEKENGGLDGLEAVIDKDLAAERLAEAVKAELLLILTDVEYVFLNYNSSNQEKIQRIKLDKIKEYYNKGKFPPGSMGPKILAAIRFLESGGKRVIIANLEKAWDSLQGKTGTIIEK
jgi:carbamate kinase